MKNYLYGLIGFFIFSTCVYAEHEGVTSLRGTAEISNVTKVPDIKKIQHDKGPVARNYLQQPPLIPHSIQGYKINLRSNKCLTCHSWKNYLESGATKISMTHFKDRDGNELADVSPRRFFCNQCHVPQVDAKPLVKNNFSPVNTEKKLTEKR